MQWGEWVGEMQEEKYWSKNPRTSQETHHADQGLTVRPSAGALQQRVMHQKQRQMPLAHIQHLPPRWLFREQAHMFVLYWSASQADRTNVSFLQVYSAPNTRYQVSVWCVHVSFLLKQCLLKKSLHLNSTLSVTSQLRRGQYSMQQYNLIIHFFYCYTITNHILRNQVSVHRCNK